MRAMESGDFHGEENSLAEFLHLRPKDRIIYALLIKSDGGSRPDVKLAAVGFLLYGCKTQGNQLLESLRLSSCVRLAKVGSALWGCGNRYNALCV